MPQITLAVEHGRSLPEARERLAGAVGEVQQRFPAMVGGVNWSPNRDAASVTGRGFRIDLRVDEKHVHVTGELGGVAGMLVGPLTAGVKGIVQRVFQKRLT